MTESVTAAVFDPLGTLATPLPGNDPGAGVHAAGDQPFVDLSAADLGVHGAVEQDFAAAYDVSVASLATPPAAAPAAPPAAPPSPETAETEAPPAA